tara:strand:- start:3863 stop:4315 length:453 start_codon:yes stop_codon:yes gene_type:complete
MIKVNADKITEIVISGLQATMNAKGRNATQRSISSVYSVFDDADMVLTFYGADHWQYIEKGRKPGGKPPYSRILEWCIAKGIPQEAAWAIRANIGKYGAPRKIRGTSLDESKLHVIEDTMKEVQPDIIKELSKDAAASFEATIGKQWQSL